MVNPALPRRLTGRDSDAMTCRSVIASLCLVVLIAPVEGGVPKPRAKPATPREIGTDMIPIPRPNPRRAASKAPAALPDDDGQSAGAWSAAARSEAVSSCRTALSGLDVVYALQPAIGRAGGCGTAAPIELSQVAGVVLTPPAVVNCDVAKALHDWVTTGVQPAARRRLKTKVTEIHVAASYVCRRRNNARSGKLSEHGRANAIDMSGFSFARSDAVAVSGSWGEGLLASIGLSRSGSFLGDIRKDACSFFSTVLGPGSDRYHGDHFHVDVLRRRGDYRICK